VPESERAHSEQVVKFEVKSGVQIHEKSLVFETPCYLAVKSVPHKETRATLSRYGPVAASSPSLDRLGKLWRLPVRV
jgi:hypothetical protein